MAISIVNAASASSTNLTDVTSLVISKPTSTASGDFLVAIVVAHSTASITSSGWTQVASATDSGGTKLKTWFLTKTAGGSEPSTYTFSWSGGASAAGGIIAYRGSNGLASVNLGTMPQSGNTLADPSTEPGVYEMTQPYSSGYALVWHDNRSGGSPAVTCTGSTGTERWDVSTIDGAPSTHERGMAAYTKTGIGAEGSDSFNATANPTQTIDGLVHWSWAVAEQPYATGSATHSGATAAGTGTVTSNPTGSGALLHSGATADGTAYEWPTADGAALHSGATADGVAYEWPAADGAVLHSGATAAGTGYEWPTIDGACLHSGAIASGEAVVSGTKLEIKVDGVWTDITGAIRHNSAVTITRGRSSSGQSMTTTRCSFTLDNRDHQFSPFNPNGDYYGYLGRNTEIRVIKQETGVRFHGELSSYTFGTDRSGNDLVVDIECAGLLRRLEQGEAPIGSPLYREITTSSPVAYWPCEDEGGSTLAAAVGGSQATPLASLVGRIRSGSSELASYDAFKCSDKLPQIGSAQWVFPQITGAEVNSADGVTLTFLLASPGGMTNGTTIMTIQGLDSDTDGWEMFTLKYSATNTLQLVRDTDGGSTTIAGATRIVGQPGVMVFISLVDTNPIGGSFEMALWAQGPEDTEPTLLANSLTGGSISSSLAVRVNPTLAALNEASSAYLGHLAAWATHASEAADIADLPVFASLNAYLGERAGTRFERLCTEQGITFEAVGTMADTVRMGYQTSKGFTDLLRECEESDQGMMFEIRDDLGLGYRTGRSLYNQTATATFSYTGGHLLDELKPIYDDKDIRNEVTVTRDGGSSATYEKTAGKMSTLAVPDGVGKYDDSVTVSLYQDDDAYVQAGWRVHKGTVDEIRVQSISTGLEVPEIDADNALTVALLALDVGHRVVVEDTPAWMPVDDVDQIIQGYTERWDPTEHRFSFNTDPASPYRVARLTAAGTSSTQAKLGGARQARLHGALDSTDTTFTVNFDGMGDNEEGATSIFGPANPDFDIIVGGERMTVTGVTNPGGDQAALTVTRSVNGIVKAHATETEVNFYRPAKIGL